MEVHDPQPSDATHDDAVNDADCQVEEQYTSDVASNHSDQQDF